MLQVLQRHQYTLDRPFSYAYAHIWIVAGATTAILPLVAAPLEDFLKGRSRIFFEQPLQSHFTYKISGLSGLCVLHCHLEKTPSTAQSDFWIGLFS